MSTLTTFPFHPDLTDCLLMALPSFQSLQAFISSSKFVYAVFRCRQNSILAAVAHNQFDFALPQAMRLVRYLDGSALAYELHQEVDFPQDFTITPAQARHLRDRAAVIQTLEDIYSWREKDPRSRSSQLTVTESRRFQQSVYRFWLLAAMYGPEAQLDGRLEFSSDDHLQLRESIITNQISFLLSLGENELLGVDEIHRFLLDLAKWALVKHTSRPTRFGDRDDIYLVWSGPAVTLDAFRGKWPSFRHIGSHWYGIWRAMTHAFFASEIASATTGRVLSTTRQHFVLDDHFSNSVDCSRCEGSRSLSGRGSLWSFCNWEYMILDITPSCLASFLLFERGSLGLLVSFTEAIESIPYPQFIEEIFDIRSEQYKDWKKADWLCTHCMNKLLSDNIQIWFDEWIRGVDAPTGFSVSLNRGETIR